MTMEFGYYDFVLGVIPVSMVSVPAMLFIIGFPFAVSIIVGSFVSVALVGHAMFVHPPTDTIVPKTKDDPATEKKSSSLSN